MTAAVESRRAPSPQAAGVVVRELACPGLWPDPRALWDAAAGSPWRFWLESGGGPAARYSYVAWGNPLWVFRGRGGRGEWIDAGGRVRRFSFRDPTAVLRRALRGRGRSAGGTGFPGGAVGFWGYESARYFDKFTNAAAGKADLPDFIWVMPRFWAVLDKETKTAALLQQSEGAEAGDSLRAVLERLRGLPREGEGRSHPARGVSGPSVPSLARGGSRASYQAKVREIKKLIAAGDIYQANLTHRVNLPWPAAASPADFFDELRRLNPSPYSLLFQGPDFSLASCSPELLLRVRGDRLETRPIAGTRPRGATSREDRRLSGELLLSAKERAEHVMLLDLERNDLGRVSRPGSVRVTDRLVLEKYSHVIHIVSQVEGRLRPGLDGLDALKAVFPGGTITGCPKIRCMEVLSEMEGESRGPFFGSAGWIGLNGDSDMNILIRTALIRRGRLSLRVGAGIVADSDPAREYEETLHKARALLSAYQRTLARIK